MQKRRVIQTWYRSVRDGKTWCESSDPDEVIARSRNTDTFQKFDVVTVYEDWVPWQVGNRQCQPYVNGKGWWHTPGCPHIDWEGDDTVRPPCSTGE